MRFADRESTIRFDPPRPGQETVLRLYDAANGEPGLRVNANAPQHTPAAGNVTVKNYGENAGVAEALARSGALVPQREVLGGMLVEMKMVDPSLRAELQKHERSQELSGGRNQPRKGSGHER